MRLAQRVDRLLEELARLLLGQHTVLDEACRVRLANRGLLVDSLRHQRLRVRRLVLLVVPETAVADEIDDEVVAELLAVGERKPDRGERGLRVVGVDVDDRDVEALGEIARVARGAPLGGIGREADLVVRDDVERAARRVAVDGVEVERLRDDALARERRIPVDQDRERDRRVVDAGASRAIRLLRSGMAFDDRVDRLQVARVGGQRDLNVAGACLPRLGGCEVVLHVAGSALGIGDEGVDRALALELPQDRRVGAAHRVREHVEPAAVRDADDDLVRTRGSGELDGEIQHRHERVEAFDGELLLPDERAPQVRLEGFDLREPQEKRTPFLWRQWLAEATGLDRAPEPDALSVIGDVLDLVGDRPHVDLLQPREGVEQRLALAGEPQEARGDLRLDLGGQSRIQALGLERGIAGGLGPERIEASREVTVHADRLDERHRGRDGRQEIEIRGFGRRFGRSPLFGGRSRRRFGRRLFGRCDRRNCRGRAVAAVGRAHVDEPREPRERR